MKQLRFSLVFALLLSLCVVLVAQAQSQDLTISMRRDFGYSSGGGDIQGLFSITANGPADLQRVAFYVDQTLIGEAAQSPFRIQFNTDNYSIGQHTIYARGTLSGGLQIKSRVVTANFVSASDGGQAAMKIAIPILSISLLAVVLAAVIPLLTGKKTQVFPAGLPLSYPMGGAICPKCASPFAVHIYGMNLFLYKYDRCPYCGKWSLVRRVPLEILRAAEQLQLARANEKALVPEASIEEKLKKELDDSKYREM